MLLKILYLLFLLTLSSSKLNVHVIPHTHDDVGWLFTLDQYYQGNNNMGKCVKCILDSMVETLDNHPLRKFTYVEMAFFEKWYYDQPETVRQKVKRFVKDEQLEFINGGWVMNDEATVVYQDIIDNLRMGLLFLKKEFNYTPKVAWYIDPFGHSLSNAYILSQLGFEKLVLVRIDSREKEHRKSEKTMEFVWQPYGEYNNTIFTHIAYGHYNPPDSLSNIVWYDMTQFNLATVYNDIEKISQAYRTNEVFFFFGDDFTFDTPHKFFTNAEALMKAFADDPYYKDKIEFKFSTPSLYFKAVESYKVDFPVTKDIDFFPYSEYSMDYWTGYFTSRPYLKGIVRDAGSYLNIASKLLLNHMLSLKQGLDVKAFTDKLYILRRELSIAQHHDGVSGTGREEVSNDYIARIMKGIDATANAIKDLIDNELNRLHYDVVYTGICSEAVANKDCINKIFGKEQIEAGVILVLINPGLEGDIPFKVRVDPVGSIRLTDISDSTDMNIDFICDGKYLPSSTYCTINTLLQFSSNEVFKIIALKAEDGFNKPIDPLSLPGKIILIDRSDYKLEYDSSSGEIRQTEGNVETTFKINHAYFTYNSYNDPKGKNRSGAYLMATDSNTPISYSLSSYSNYFKGKDVTQINLVFDHSIIKLRIYNRNQYKYIIDTESIIFSGRPSGVGEFILAINSNINNVNSSSNTVFYTDTNGLKIIKRTRDTREFYPFTVDDPTASNFYPVNSVISVKDDTRVLNVFNDRSQAGTSIRPGEIYLVLNRWSDKDDRKGLSRGINEQPSTNNDFHINHWIALGKKAKVELLTTKPLYAIYNPSDKVSLSRMKNKFISQYLYNRSYIPPEYTNFRVKYIYSMLFESDSCIETNYYFITEHQVILQFLNKRDRYLNDGDDMCTVRLNPDISYKITKLNGIDQLMEINVMEFLKPNTDNQYQLRPYEFLTVLYELNK
jgi:alpha-mannosidase